MDIRQEEDIPLVDNAAAASLFSPNMWVHRPNPRARGTEPRRPPSTIKRKRREDTDKENWQQPQQQQQQQQQQNSDQDLQYLESSGDEKQKEIEEEDLAIIAAHRQLLWQWEEDGKALHGRMNDLAEEADHLHRESHNIRHLFKIFNVIRDDFSAFHPECNSALAPEERQRKLIATGERILASLDGLPCAAAPSQPAQAPVPHVPHAQVAAKKRRRAAAVANTLIHQIREEDQEDEAPHQDGTTRTPTEAVIKEHQADAFTPRDYPEESVVAAAAMSLKQSDAGSAMLLLLQQAYMSHLEAKAARLPAVVAAPVAVEQADA